MIRITSMKKEHIDRISEIENICFETPWSRESFEKELDENSLAYYIVGISEDQVLGYAGMWVIVDEGHITNIAVHPDFHNKGIGSQLVRSLIHEAKNRGLVGLTLEVRQSNVKAQNLYTKFGFLNGGIRKRYYQDTGEDAMIMWKYL